MPWVFFGLHSQGELRFAQNNETAVNCIAHLQYLLITQKYPMFRGRAL